MYIDGALDDTETDVGTWAKNRSDCEKIKAQISCDAATSCGDMPSHCGFCPSIGQVLAATDGPKPLPKYDRDNIQQQSSDISGDKCPDLGVNINPSDTNSPVWFDSLRRSTDYTLCDGQTYIGDGYNDACMNSLWQSAKIDSGYSAKCITRWQDISDNQIISENSISNKSNIYYKLNNDMKKVNDKLIQFYKDHRDRNDRTHKLSKIDKEWKLCFGKKTEKIFYK